MTDLPDYAVNLRRLFAWHGQSNKDVAALLGATEHTVSGWLTGKRSPSSKYLLAIGELYDVNPAKLSKDPDEFGPDIADSTRYREAEERIAKSRRTKLRAV